MFVKNICLCFVFQHTLHVFPPIVTVYRFKGRPQIMVYPPRNTPCHVCLYVAFLETMICGLPTTPYFELMLFIGRP